MGLFNRKKSTSFWSKKIDSMGPALSRDQKQELNDFRYTKPNPPNIVSISDMNYFSRFSFSEIPVLDWNIDKARPQMRYVLVGENLNQAVIDIMSLQKLKNLADYEPAYKRHFDIVQSELLFPDLSNLRWDVGFTWLEICPLTNTGKIGRYPVALHFYSEPQDKKSPKRLSGTIYYLQNGEIGKFEMSRMLKDCRVDMKHIMKK